MNNFRKIGVHRGEKVSKTVPNYVTRRLIWAKNLVALIILRNSFSYVIFGGVRKQ